MNAAERRVEVLHKKGLKESSGSERSQIRLGRKMWKQEFVGARVPEHFQVSWTHEEDG